MSNQNWKSETEEVCWMYWIMRSIFVETKIRKHRRDIRKTLTHRQDSNEKCKDNDDDSIFTLHVVKRLCS